MDPNLWGKGVRTVVKYLFICGATDTEVNLFLELVGEKEKPLVNTNVVPSISHAISNQLKFLIIKCHLIYAYKVRASPKDFLKFIL
jgi:hypothetical protein